jgi:ATP-dependent helicase HepA
VLQDAFPGLHGGAVTVTSSRAVALHREEVQFLTWDHPLAGGALDLLLASEKGNCAFARWVDASRPTLYLEASFLLEAIAPPALHIDRFLPPTPVRVVVDHAGQNATLALPPGRQRLQAAASGRALLGRADVRDRLLPKMVESAKALANEQVPALISSARQAMHAALADEIARLTQLRQRNPVVREEELAALRQQRDDLDAHLFQARLRLDAVRLIHRGPDRESTPPGASSRGMMR